MVKNRFKVSFKITALIILYLFVCNSLAIAQIDFSIAPQDSANLSPTINIYRPVLQNAASEIFKANGIANTFNQEAATYVKFSQYAPQASKVYLSGDFNNWNPADENYAMVKGKDGDWTISLFGLPVGTKYKFVVDGQWQLNNKLEYYPDAEGNLNHILTAAQGGLPSDVVQFVSALKRTVGSIRNGEWGKIVAMTNIREMYKKDGEKPGMGEIYNGALESISNATNGNIDNLITKIDPNDPAHDRNHDLAGCMANMESLLNKYTLEQIMQKVVLVVSDGGFKTRLGPLTLANGYNGIVTLPGGKNFRQVNLEVLATVMKQMKNGLTDFMGWAASDNYTFFGKANWNNRPLSELPTEKATIIAVGKRAQVLLPEEQQWLENEVKALTGKTDVRIGWEQIMSNSSLQQQIIDAIKAKGYKDLINSRILEERLESLGTFAAEPVNGTMSWFGEKETMPGFEVNLKLVRAANQNGGYIYKNVFLEFVNKEFMLKLYKGLHTYDMHDPKTGEVLKNKDGVVAKLDNLPVSFMQSILQSRFMAMKEWMETGVMPERSSPERERDWKKIPHKNITDGDWMAVFTLVETLFNEEEEAGRGNVYVVDMGEGAVWIDAGDLEKIVELMQFVTNTETGRLIAELPPINVNMINAKISKTLEAHISKNSYLENVVATGEGTLVVRDGVVLRDVILPEIPKGKVLDISENSMITESDLRPLTDLEIDRGGVINRYFDKTKTKLIVGPNELFVSVNVPTSTGDDYSVKTPGVVIAMPYKGTSLAEILLSKEIWWDKFVLDIHKNKPELAMAGVSAETDWEKLRGKYDVINDLLKKKQVSLIGLLNGSDIAKLGLEEIAEQDVVSRLGELATKIQQRWQALVKLHPVLLQQYSDMDITKADVVSGFDWNALGSDIINLEDEQLGSQDFNKAQRIVNYNWMDANIKQLAADIKAETIASYTGASSSNLESLLQETSKVKKQPVISMPATLVGVAI